MTLRNSDDHLGAGRIDSAVQLFADTYPDAELIMIGVEEPMALIHAPMRVWLLAKFSQLL